jgi:DNA-binding GntR family transcriptional regulator
VSAVEGLAAYWAARRAVADRQRVAVELRLLNRSLLEAASDGRRDVDLVFELDAGFHRAVVEAGSGPRLLAMHDSIKPQSERYGRIYSSALIGEMPTSVAEHDLITTAIEDGEPDAAEQAMRRNWINASERLAQVIATLGERGTW